MNDGTDLCSTCNGERGRFYELKTTARGEEREIRIALCDDCAAEFGEVEWISVTVAEQGSVETDQDRMLTRE
jgi:hypothetical protein